MARLTTVFGIGIAALASCQPFRDSGYQRHEVIEEFAELDECLDGGGSWSMDSHRCETAIEGETAVTP